MKTSDLIRAEAEHLHAPCQKVYIALKVQRACACDFLNVCTGVFFICICIVQIDWLATATDTV